MAKRIPRTRLPAKKSSPDLSAVQRDDLGRVKKGSPGIPGAGGIPLKYGSWATMIASVMAEEGIDGRTDKEKIVRKVKDLALIGVEWAIEFMADREDGKPISSLDVTTKGQGLNSKLPDLSSLPTEALLKYLEGQSKK